MLPAAAIEEHVDALFSELSLALRWKRPSILLAVCSTAAIRKKAQGLLSEALDGIGQKTIPFAVTVQNYDIALKLTHHPERNKAVFYVTGFNRGGGSDKRNAFYAINIRRELFVDHPTRVVFWLTRAEAKSLPILAPDFWAFRHMVVYL